VVAPEKLMTFQFNGENKSSNMFARTHMDYMSRGLGRSEVEVFDALLARISRENPQLDTLNLGHNSLTDVFVDSIIQHLISNPVLKMKKLDLGNNLLTDVGVEKILVAIEARADSSFTQLFLRGNRGVSFALIQRVEAMMANNARRLEEKPRGR